MYNFIRSYTKTNSIWTLNDVHDQTVQHIIDNYEAVRLVCTWGAETVEFEIHLRDNRNNLFLVDLSQTVETWLNGYTANSLISRPEVKRLGQVRTVKFQDLHHYNLSYGPGNHMYGPGIIPPKNTNNDLMCTSDLPSYDERSMSNLGKNAVIAVNGHICKTIEEHDKLWAVDAGSHLNQGSSNVFSVIDFTDIGGCEKAYCADENTTVALRTMSDERLYISRVLVNTGVSLQKRTPILVIDGNLYMGDDWLKVVSETEVMIDVHHDVVLRRANDRTKEILGFVDPTNARDNGINALTLDVKKLMLDTDTFLLLLNTDELCVQKEQLGPTKIEGFYTHYRAPVGLCFFENGKLAPYHFNDYNAWTVCMAVGANIRRNMMDDTINWTDVQAMWDVERENREDTFMDAEVVDLYVF